MPETCTRTPLGGRIPAAARWKWDDVATTPRGTTPSANTCPASYTSARKASSVRTRCWTPRSMVVQVSISMTRGRMSSGNARSSPPMSKVTPWSRYDAWSASTRPASSGTVISCSEDRSRRYGARSSSSSSNISS